jgi:hypothetical protein
MRNRLLNIKRIVVVLSIAAMSLALGIGVSASTNIPSIPEQPQSFDIPAGTNYGWINGVPTLTDSNFAWVNGKPYGVLNAMTSGWTHIGTINGVGQAGINSLWGQAKTGINSVNGVTP